MAKMYKGVRIPFTMRIPADLHRICASRARERHWSLNQFLIWAIADAVTRLGEDVPDVVGVHQNVAVYDDDGQRVGFV
jgi:HicB family